MISPENLSTPFKFSSNQYNYKHTADMIIPGTKIKIKDQNWFESNCSYYDKIKDVLEKQKISKEKIEVGRKTSWLERKKRK